MPQVPVDVHSIGLRYEHETYEITPSGTALTAPEEHWQTLGFQYTDHPVMPWPRASMSPRSISTGVPCVFVLPSSTQGSVFLADVSAVLTLSHYSTITE